MRTGNQARSLGEITVGRGAGRGRGDLVTIVFPWAFQSRSGKTNSRSKQNSRLASKNFIKGRNELGYCVCSE